MIKVYSLTSICTVVAVASLLWLLPKNASQAKDLFGVPSRSRYAPPKSFFCDVRKVEEQKKVLETVPTTLAQTDRGEVVIYYWKQPYYPDLAETPLARCRRVAGILDTLNQKKLLSALKVGEMDDKQVICVADSANSPCTRVVFPLVPNENPQEVLEDLQEAIKGKPYGGGGGIFGIIGDIIKPGRRRGGGSR